jgi:plastocyanin
MMMKLRSVTVAAAFGVLAVACGGGGGTASQPTTPATSGAPSSPSPAVTAGCAPSGDELHVLARQFKFNATCLAAPADTAFTIELDNRDLAMHNFVIEDGDQFLNGEPVSGKTITYKVDPIPAGIYTFYCKFHPAQMQGQFVVQ